MELESVNILKNTINTAVQQAFNNYQQKEWLSLKDGAFYAGVSYNTFIKFREMGLEVAEIDGIKRVSKSSIDSFFHQHSF